MKRSSLFPIHQTLGAVFTHVGEWEVPQHFGTSLAEYQALRQGVALSDLSSRGLIRMTGKDRQRFLHAMVSNDTASLQPGEGCYATFLTVKGHLVADFVVYAEEDAYRLELEPQVVGPFLEAIDWFIIGDDVTCSDESGTWGLLAIQGPRAAALVTRVLGHEVPDLPMYASLPCTVEGVQTRLIRRSYTGEPGYLLRTSTDTLAPLWQALWSHAEAYQAGAVGVEALNMARIEDGVPVYGQDMSDATIPIEANLQSAISYTKGCYVGQEVIARIEARGHVNRKLVGLLLSGDVLPESGAKIVSPQRDVGWITSATYSPALQRPIAMGYVRREVVAPGTALEVHTNGTPLAATVVELPFYKP
jgi:aminomethyltransferase